MTGLKNQIGSPNEKVDVSMTLRWNSHLMATAPWSRSTAAIGLCASVWSRLSERVKRLRPRLADRPHGVQMKHLHLTTHELRQIAEDHLPPDSLHYLAEHHEIADRRGTAFCHVTTIDDCMLSWRKCTEGQAIRSSVFFSPTSVDSA
jgi:hypothetical protein